MDAPFRRSRLRLRVVPDKPPTPAPLPDELKVARQRMRHLAPWNVRPVPTTHSAHGKPDAPAARDPSARSRQMALTLLAIHMAQAATKGRLR